MLELKPNRQLGIKYISKLTPDSGNKYTITMPLYSDKKGVLYVPFENFYNILSWGGRRSKQDYEFYKLDFLYEKVIFLEKEQEKRVCMFESVEFERFLSAWAEDHDIKIIEVRVSDTADYLHTNFQYFKDEKK